MLLPNQTRSEKKLKGKKKRKKKRTRSRIRIRMRNAASRNRTTEKLETTSQKYNKTSKLRTDIIITDTGGKLLPSRYMV